MTSQDNSGNWRDIVIKTNGIKWKIISDKTNSSLLEIKEICREILKALDIYNIEG